MSKQDEQVLVATRGGLFDIESSRPIAFAGESVESIIRDGEGLLAIVDSHRICRWNSPAIPSTDDDPEGWCTIATITDYDLSCVLATPPWLFVGTVEAHLYRLRRDGSAEPEDLPGFERTFDRERWFTPWGGPPAVRSFAFDGDKTVYVNVHVGGVLATDDWGESFSQTIDISSDVHEVLYDRENDVLLAAAGRGFGVGKRDGTAVSWDLTCDGLHGCYMRAVALSDGAVLASASNGPHGDRGAVYRRTAPADGTFARCTEGLPDWFGGNVDTGHVAAHGRSAAIGAPRGAVYLSSDAGERWDCVRSDLPQIHAVLVR